MGPNGGSVAMDSGKYFVTVTLRESQLFCLPTWHLLQCPVVCLPDNLISFDYFSICCGTAHLQMPFYGKVYFYPMCRVGMKCLLYTRLTAFWDCMAYILLDVGLHIASFPFYILSMPAFRIHSFLSISVTDQVDPWLIGLRSPVP